MKVKHVPLHDYYYKFYFKTFILIIALRLLQENQINYISTQMFSSLSSLLAL
jgi:hypothetical protein